MTIGCFSSGSLLRPLIGLDDGSLQVAGKSTDQNTHHGSQVKRSGNAGGHTHHSGERQHRIDISKAHGGEANEGEVVNRRKNMGGCKHTRPSTDWDVERSEAAWLDGFQGTHHEASGQADVEIARCGAHQ